MEILGAQDERVFVEFSTKTLAGLGIDRASLIASLQAQNAVSPAGTLQTGDEKLALRVTGAFETEQDILDVNMSSVFAVVPAMLFITVTLLMIQLQSFSRMLLVLSVVPLSLIGVVAALLLFNKPVGFVAILGILALLGMIARNSVILIDQIENERAEGGPIWDAVIAAAMSRFRPIMLTAVSTVLGLIPIASTIFWGPMAYAIMGGLLVATVLTVIFLPALYEVWFRAKKPGDEYSGTAPVQT